MQTTIEKDGDGDREIILKCVWTNASYSLSLDYFDYKLTMLKKQVHTILFCHGGVDLHVPL